ncbi:MAG: sulfite oxidase [Acidobacteriaceae bacterium]
MTPTAASESSTGLKTRIHKPLNVEASFLNPPTPITGVENFYIRDHFPLPKIDPVAWRLKVGGAVDKPLELSLADLKAMAVATHTCVLECAGNGRLFLHNVPEGVQWGLGAAGCAAWTGVRLRDVLALAGVKAGAVEAVFQGADHGVADKQFKPKGEIHYSRSLPVDVGMRPEVLLAWAMNGDALSSAHGAPVRLVVPGWYSMAAVKWLTEITVVERPFLGYFQTVEYTYWAHRAAQGDGLPPERIPIEELLVKSQIAHPVMHQEVLAGETCRVHGAAWGGGAGIAKVEVSTDRGATWHGADFDGAPEDHAWQLWHWDWKPSRRGKRGLMSRATDAKGNVQPSQHDEDHESYMIHHTVSIPVEVV